MKNNNLIVIQQLSAQAMGIDRSQKSIEINNEESKIKNIKLVAAVVFV